MAHGRKTLRHDNFAIAAIKNHRIESVSYMGRRWYDRYRNAVVEQLANRLLTAASPSAHATSNQVAPQAVRAAGSSGAWT